MPRGVSKKKQIEVVNIDEDYFKARNEIEEKPLEADVPIETPKGEAIEEPTECVKMKKTRVKKQPTAPPEGGAIEEPENTILKEEPEAEPEKPITKANPPKVMCMKCGKLVSPKTLNYTHRYQCKAQRDAPKIVSKKVIKTVKYLDNKHEDINDSSENSENEESLTRSPSPKAKAKAKAKAKIDRSRYSHISLF